MPPCRHFDAALPRQRHADDYVTLLLATPSDVIFQATVRYAMLADAGVPPMPLYYAILIFTPPSCFASDTPLCAAAFFFSIVSPEIIFMVFIYYRQSRRHTLSASTLVYFAAAITP